LKRLKRPAKIRVKKGVEYDVYLFKSDKLDGECVKDINGLRQIFINESLSASEEELTLLHEALHSLSFEYKIDLTERQVRKLEKALLYFLKHNKEIFNDR
jgi:Zn-dependent peptidase ImmA (M78 family)